MDVPPATPAGPVARLNARFSAYLVDSVILLAFILVCFVIAGGQLLLASGWGEGDPSDAAIVAFVAILSAGPLLSWTAFNVALLRWRGQTAGMYVIGIKVVGEDAAALTTRRVLIRWFAMHPLLFHPFLLPAWTMLMLVSVDFAFSRFGIVVAVTVVLLTVVSIVVNPSLMRIDAGRRALHDHLARTLVVHLEQP